MSSSIEIENISTYSDYSASVSETASQDLDKEAFLGLLTAQLQYQDPLEPQDNSEFVAQLAQFSSLEQMMGMNTSMENLYLAVASLNNASMTQLLGTVITAVESEFHYSGDGEMDLQYEAVSECSSSTVTVTDAEGNIVWSEELGGLDEGEGSWTWDGSTISGGTAGEGTYSFTISGYDASGDAVEVVSLLVGEVDGMNYESGSPVPSVNGIEVNLSDILEVRNHSDEDDEDE